MQNTGRGGTGEEQAIAAQRQIIETFLLKGIGPTIKNTAGKTVLESAEKSVDQGFANGNIETLGRRRDKSSERQTRILPARVTFGISTARANVMTLADSWPRW